MFTIWIGSRENEEDFSKAGGIITENSQEFNKKVRKPVSRAKIEYSVKNGRNQIDSKR